MPQRIRRPRPDGTVPTSSLADIAFLLLIFFLVTTVFEEERGLSIVVPEAVEAPVPAQNLLVLMVRADGLVEVRAGESGFTRTVDAAAVSGIWRDAVAENPLVIAAVKTDPQAPYRRAIDVLDELYGAGATRVSLQEWQRR